MSRRPALSILVLPGGTDFSHRPFSKWQPSALRMYPFTWSLRARFGSRVHVTQVEYGVYGWNGDQASPMVHARAALDALAADNPGAPIVVVGHSMGGRIAAQLAADRRIVGVVALAPWWQFADWREIHGGAKVLAMHGSADKVTYASRTRKGVQELTARGVDATYVDVPGGAHAMLDHINQWQSAPIRFVNEILRQVN
ncbi:alpha/beta fold hydrolase [Gordonia sp. TBRC 11910]|uniref:Alpha/beta fold hydrolase n=1 Tax=Gordonia asplenii TaxID=2725283 RepID=A0A848KZN6_9ACTN|nr:alpha/beta fold hydrolase [Gordonia asplenii]NMO01863.1 alpha/beta fold hydrolase [Gordonia asplenii]